MGGQTEVQKLPGLRLTRGVGEAIRIGGNITVTVTKIWGNRVRLVTDAPRDLPITRSTMVPQRR